MDGYKNVAWPVQPGRNWDPECRPHRYQSVNLHGRRTDMLIQMKYASKERKGLSLTSSFFCVLQGVHRYARYVWSLDATGEFLFGTTETKAMNLPLTRPDRAALESGRSLHEGNYDDSVNASEELQAVALIGRSRRSCTIR